jgi:hypothetical protein
MGLYIIYNDAIRILIPRDLHIGNKAFEMLEPGTEITVEIRKSRFQIQDLFILSIGILVGDIDEPVSKSLVIEENENEATPSPNNNVETSPPVFQPNSEDEA